ncbi:glutamate 5-kinase [Sulfurimonas sp. C5]|uniref:glutamate 5-kinase n=1 Tax=Sulfurimonas sp. C5 TaxID=3036947 RepID=UPI0024557D8A|nr:glutamate 5-kinase [Sulfurimonas sp. C5]MDH4944415.1 glutamate 5-kinase [Sulfurimonas sp. C5]
MKRIVFKVGSSVLTNRDEVAKERMLNLVSLIAEARKKYEVILVTSGAVASGYTALKIDRKKAVSKRLLASVGQPILMHSYKNKFDIYGVDIAQILLTEEDFDSRVHTKIFQDIIDSALANGIIPIVNENDISTIPDQLFGDNDQLSAHVAHYTNSDTLIILSDIQGYYEENPKKNPNAKLLQEVNEITNEDLNQEHSPNNEFASGGIVTKLKAAKYMMDNGRSMFLCSGFDLKAAKDFLFSEKYESGTLFRKK